MYYVSDRLTNTLYRVVNMEDWSYSFKQGNTIVEEIKDGIPYFGERGVSAEKDIVVPFIGEILDYLFVKCRLASSEGCNERNEGTYVVKQFTLIVNGIGLEIEYRAYKDNSSLLSNERRLGMLVNFPVILCGVYYVFEPKNPTLCLPDFITRIASSNEGFGFIDLDDKMKRKDINLVLPERLTSLESYSFERCSYIKSVSIGSSLRVIPSNCFGHCNNLTSMEFRQDLFNSDSLYMYDITRRAITIEHGAFNHCALQKMTIPYTIISIGELAFGYCEYLTQFTALGVGVIKDGAFCGCVRLELFSQYPELEYPLISIGFSAFNGCCNLSSFNVFAECNLFVRDNAFQGCENLRGISLSIPDEGELSLDLYVAVRKAKLPESIITWSNASI